MACVMHSGFQNKFTALKCIAAIPLYSGIQIIVNNNNNIWNCASHEFIIYRYTFTSSANNYVAEQFEAENDTSTPV